MTAFVYALLAAFANVIGGMAVARSARRGLRFINGCIAFGAGFMLAVAFLGMLPTAFAQNGPTAAAYVLAGYLLVHLTQHTLIPHFHFGEETHHLNRVVSTSALIGLLLHTFFDGVAIASGVAVSPELGALLFVAIFLHKLPEGVTITSIQIAGGFGRGKAVAGAALLGIATVAGVLLTDTVAFLAVRGLSLSAGVTIYVAASNLVPEFQQKSARGLPVLFFLGTAAYVVAAKLLAIAGLN
ncbi:MAG TPA: ZIP family metal transporter [Gemmatimonadales bacterium]